MVPEILIIGGGIAGLWLLDELRRKGYDVLLVEKTALGSCQTMAAQGILHGGLKHALAGRLGTHVDALQNMPTVWRECLAGQREPNLVAVKLRGESCHVWRTGSFVSTLGQFGVRLGLRTSVSDVSDTDRPLPLRDAPGSVLRTDEQVVDPMSLIAVLAQRNRERIICGTAGFGLGSNGHVSDVLINGDGAPYENVMAIYPKTVVLTAGEGNNELRRQAGLPADVARLLPLRILVMRGRLPLLNGFCMDGTKAKVVITTQVISDAESIWQVASERAESVSDTDFSACALRELKEALPGFEWPACSTQMYVSNRAEAVTPGERSNDAQVRFEGNVITAWPTKLVLAPRLTEHILGQIAAPSGGSDIRSVVADWPRPPVAPFPWL